MEFMSMQSEKAKIDSMAGEYFPGLCSYTNQFDFVEGACPALFRLHFYSHKNPSTVYPPITGGVGREAAISLTGFHLL
jgi:hypothetical protein